MPTRRDAGFTLLEVLVSISVVTVVLAAVTTFFVRGMAVTSQQRDRQVAIQLANAAMERARSIRGYDVVAGRACAANGTCNTSLPGDPLAASTVRINTVEYQQAWDVRECWQQRGATDCGDDANDAPFYRVVVTVTWSGARCTPEQCTYRTGTLINAASGDPVFVTQPLGVAEISDQIGEVSVPISAVTVVATGGSPPVRWAAPGLPPGLSIGDDSGVISGTPTQAGTFGVTVTATDRLGVSSTMEFSWTILPLPTLTSPGAQVTPIGNAVSLSPLLSGGMAPYTWEADGLPAGLSINPSTGVISGAPTTVNRFTVKVTVTDAFDRADDVTFTWVISSLSLGPQGNRITPVGNTVSLPLTATGGTTPYAWSASQLPTGLTISASTGRITGVPTAPGSYAVTVRVTDASRVVDAVTFTWVISTLSLATPANQAGALGTSKSLQLQVTGGTAPYQWAAANLPPGLVLNQSGLISGRPTAGTRYIVTVTVTDAAGAVDTVTFRWSVTSTTALRISDFPDVTSPSGVRFDEKFPTVSGGDPPYDWVVTGLPPGMQINENAERVFGTPTTDGVYQVKGTVIDKDGDTATYMFLWTVT